MKLAREIRRKMRGLLVPLLVVGLFGYTQYHLFSGDRGLFVWFNLREQVSDLKKENILIAEKRDRLSEEVERLKTTKPDLDFIEQVARENLGYLKPNERVIYIQPPRALN